VAAGEDENVIATRTIIEELIPKIILPFIALPPETIFADEVVIRLVNEPSGQKE